MVLTKYYHPLTAFFNMEQLEKILRRHFPEPSNDAQEFWDEKVKKCMFEFGEALLTGAVKTARVKPRRHPYEEPVVDPDSITSILHEKKRLKPPQQPPHPGLPVPVLGPCFPAVKPTAWSARVPLPNNSCAKPGRVA